MNYFKFFPKITYNGKSAVNITRRTTIQQQLYSSPISFLSYTIAEGEKPEDIALYYYEDIGKTWLVFLANNIVDPVSQWPLSNINFDKMIIKKYTDQAQAVNSSYVGNGVINWTKNTSLTSNILWYQNAENNRISKDTYLLNTDLGLITAADWSPVRIYDYELELNENKRNIFLFNRAYAAQAEAELKDLLNV
jgi:hypothetical protein